MPEYTYTLGDVVKRARGKSGLTQSEVAEAANIDVRTVLNIENYKGNPKMEVLYPLVRVLKIDAREIFYPEIHRKTPALCQLLNITVRRSRQSGVKGATVPDIQSQQLYAAKGSLHEWHMIGYLPRQYH